MPAEKFVRAHDFYPAEALKRQQVRISGHDDARSGFDGAFEDSIILRILQDGLDLLLRLDELGHVLDFPHQRSDNSLRILEPFAPQNPLDLLQNIVRNGDFDPPFDGQLQDLPRLPPEHHRRYKNVGIEDELRLFGLLF